MTGEKQKDPINYIEFPELVKALDDIAKGRAPAGEMPSLELPKMEFRAAMWSWSQKRAREGLAKLHSCTRCDEINFDHMQMDGCRDPNCPEQ